jgi:hypothetical protein
VNMDKCQHGFEFVSNNELSNFKCGYCNLTQQMKTSYIGNDGCLSCVTCVLYGSPKSRSVGNEIKSNHYNVKTKMNHTEGEMVINILDDIQPQIQMIMKSLNHQPGAQGENDNVIKTSNCDDGRKLEGKPRINNNKLRILDDTSEHKHEVKTEVKKIRQRSIGDVAGTLRPCFKHIAKNREKHNIMWLKSGVLQTFNLILNKKTILMLQECQTDDDFNKYTGCSPGWINSNFEMEEIDTEGNPFYALCFLIFGIFWMIFWLITLQWIRPARSDVQLLWKFCHDANPDLCWRLVELISMTLGNENHFMNQLDRVVKRQINLSQFRDEIVRNNNKIITNQNRARAIRHQQIMMAMRFENMVHHTENEINSM